MPQVPSRTPQVGEVSAECLSAEDRLRVAAETEALGPRDPKLEASKRMLEGLVAPPASPQDCVFARTIPIRVVSD